MSSGTVITIILVLGILVVAYYTIKNYRKQLKQGCCGAGDDNKKTVNKVEPKDTNKANYPYIANAKIDGMSCENCARRIENAVNRIDGAWANVNFPEQSAKILLKNPALETQVKLAVSNNGYLVTECTVKDA